jgi:hypothetical protein
MEMQREGARRAAATMSHRRTVQRSMHGINGFIEQVHCIATDRSAPNYQNLAGILPVTTVANPVVGFGLGTGAMF